MDRIKKITDELSKHGLSVQTGFLAAEAVSLIVEEMDELLRDHQFKTAGIGNRQKHKQDDQVRKDLTYWLDEATSSSTQKLISAPLEELRIACNRELFFGLREIEGHYAIYEAGGFYRRHLDSFLDDDSRVLSVVLYLNSSWMPGDGGELLLHTPVPVIVEPRGGTLVTFLSHEIEHEVLEAHKVRKSYAGWFKQQSKLG